MRAGALGFYLENIERFHRLRDEATIIGLMGAHMAKFVGPGLGRGDEIDVQEGDRREKFPFQRLTYPRDPNFARNVRGVSASLLHLWPPNGNRPGRTHHPARRGRFERFGE